ncbi:family 16 glycosylhydrolase [Pelagicoccus sp. SDUM812002]|uniref:family 16 glycosylhydrolase n=1 Tax=Pelagicoccus sp. SDUM812002 TaxID=3041266 RepID=UPI00280E0201|nr:family 16 glycosylhydrolase [Pelagicoccus sp. SDUM812002]MDQ8188354.1 family 16 glycosylhydrolase [Pelagicoccus sp. SDUM812002]
MKILATLVLTLVYLTLVSVGKPYQGAELYSLDSYSYGRFEMRMKAAKASGVLSTFFTYKYDSEKADVVWEEIDIEIFGKDDGQSFQSNVITGLGERQTTEDVHRFPFSLADDFHVYALEWTPDTVAWYLDGELVRKYEGRQAQVMTSPQSLRFNLWAANIEKWVGPIESESFPVYQWVDWLRVYRYSKDSGEFELDWVDEFDHFDESRWGKADWTFAENACDFSPDNIKVEGGMLRLALTESVD